MNQYFVRVAKAAIPQFAERLLGEIDLRLGARALHLDAIQPTAKSMLRSLLILITELCLFQALLASLGVENAVFPSNYAASG